VLREQPILNLDKLHGSRTFLIIVPEMIDPRADWIAPHQPGIEGLQQVGHGSDIPHRRIVISET
jgi:hypothetical protein